MENVWLRMLEIVFYHRARSGAVRGIRRPLPTCLCSSSASPPLMAIELDGPYQSNKMHMIPIVDEAQLQAIARPANSHGIGENGR
jgi:hypothetical protein